MKYEHKCKVKTAFNKISLLRPEFFQFPRMVCRVDLVTYHASFLLQVLQIYMVRYCHMICRTLKQLLLCKYVLLLGFFLLFNRYATEQVWIYILSQGLVCDVFHFWIKRLKFFQLVCKYSLTDSCYVLCRDRLLQAVEISL